MKNAFDRPTRESMKPNAEPGTCMYQSKLQYFIRTVR